MVVLPSSVSTSGHSARASVVAIRSAGKYGSIGRYAPPALKIAMTEAIQSRFRSVTTATTPSRRSPRASSARAEPVGVRVELPVGPVPVAVHGRDGVRVHPHALLEQLVEPAVRQLPARPGQPVELEAQLLVRQQARPPVLGVRVGDHQREGGEVVAGDPLGAARVERVGAVPQVQREPAAGGRERHPEHGVLGEVGADLAAGVEAGDRVELGLERRPGHAQLTLELVHREVPVPEQVRLDPSGVLQQRPPGAGFGRERAGQRPPTGPGRVAGHHVLLAGQRRQHLRVRGQRHRVQRQLQPIGQPAHRCREVVIEGRDVLGDARCRVERPPRDRGRPACEQDSPPELPAGFNPIVHRIVLTLQVCRVS